MSFGSEPPDLSQTVFSLDNYKFANEFLRKEIDLYDPAWLKNPVGQLGTQWLVNDCNSACKIIFLARMLSVLKGRVTIESDNIFIKKFCNLLRCKNDRQYEELFAEFEVEFMFIHRASPISLEPLVPIEQIGKSNQPVSPDFAIRLPEVDVYIEVTVFRFGALDNWEKRAEHLRSDLNRQVLRNNKRRAISINFPLMSSKSALPDELRRQLINEILENESGLWNSDIFGTEATVRWAPFPHIKTLPDGSDGDFSAINELSDNLGIKPGDLAATMGPEMPPAAVGSWKKLVLDNHVNDLVLKSLKNTLKNKRRQFPHEAPYLLVIKLGHKELDHDAFFDLISKGIWPHKDYEWIMGIVIYTPRAEFEHSSADQSLNLILNPNSRTLPPASIHDLFSGKTSFHNLGPRASTT